MKKIMYIEDFFEQDLLKEIINFNQTLEFGPNHGRSDISKQIIDINKPLYLKIIDSYDKNIKIKINKCDMMYYRRNTKVFNPHIDNSKLNILVYLDGPYNNLQNGTNFFNICNQDYNDPVKYINNYNISVNIANITNSAVVFPSNYFHTSAQSINEITETRYSLNCFVHEYEDIGGYWSDL